MGWYPCECCCKCLLVADLPTVTIEGYTGNGWTGECCYEQTFTPNEPLPWSKYCSGLLYEATSTQNCVTNHYSVLSPNYRGYEFFPGGCDTLPDNHCCPEGAEHIATTINDVQVIQNAFVASWVRNTAIIVRISREKVSCENVENETGGCKIVVKSKYLYESVSRIYTNNTTQIDRSVSLQNTTCFEVNEECIVNVNPTPQYTCETIPDNPDNVGGVLACRTEAAFGFDRVKYYDDLPTGLIEFTNEDIPGCESSGCNFGVYNYSEQVCLYGPTQEINDMDPPQQFPCEFTLPCNCVGEVVETTYTASYPDLTCDLSIVNERGGCFSNPCVAANCYNMLVTLCTNLGDPIETYDCPTILETTSHEYSCYSPDGIIRTVLPYSSYGSCGCPTVPYKPLFDCTENPCNTDCCRLFDDCPCCEPECQTRYGTNIDVIQSHTLTETCTGLQSAFICVNAPSWNINLS